MLERIKEIDTMLERGERQVAQLQAQMETVRKQNLALAHLRLNLQLDVEQVEEHDQPLPHLNPARIAEQRHNWAKHLPTVAIDVPDQVAADFLDITEHGMAYATFLLTANDDSALHLTIGNRYTAYPYAITRKRTNNRPSVLFWSSDKGSEVWDYCQKFIKQENEQEYALRA